jgi:hypothetical protein
VNAESGLEEHLQLQAGSPAQDIRTTEGEQSDLAHVEQLMQASRGEQDGGEQLEGSWGEQRPPVTGKVKPLSQEPQTELHSDCLSIGGEQIKDHNDEQQSKVTAGVEQARNEQFEKLEGEQTEDRTTTSQSDKLLPDGQHSQWLKSVMPAASNGWWDVRVKGDRFTAKFRWRGPDLQVIPLFHISREEIEILKQSNREDVQRRILNQIAASLQSFLLDSAKYDKAVTAAEKLGITIENLQLRNIVN